SNKGEGFVLKRLSDGSAEKARLNAKNMATRYTAGSLYDNFNEKQESKIKCIIHYFGRICSSMPVGNVSFERKVLADDQAINCIPYPQAESWGKSVVPLCQFEVCGSGLIEDQSKEALEVDFANEYFGGGALSKGCVQEEIRFMINPELIAGMLLLPCMADNEAIEVVGAERFSNYTGYASTFRFCGDFLDTKDSDIMGRRKTRIIAIDALVHPGKRQYRHEFLLREVNKAFCGFSDPCKSHRYRILLKDHHLSEAELDQKLKSLESNSDNALV
nr:poly(ADP-ribose) glycohydrolase 1-like isoform X1 [Tanacetum cinerariifolium]GFB01144.1 poly(ADP-ribose) glycohydrolase 1-like isoform X1 [Tanacetum cinerariifolium]